MLTPFVRNQGWRAAWVLEDDATFVEAVETYSARPTECVFLRELQTLLIREDT